MGTLVYILLYYYIILYHISVKTSSPHADILPSNYPHILCHNMFVFYNNVVRRC